MYDYLIIATGSNPFMLPLPGADKEGELMVKVKTQEEVIEWTGAFIQYYRESAKYLEKTSHWVERVGLDSIKAVLADQNTRKQLIERVDQSIGATIDPWKEHIEDPNLRAMFETKKVAIQG